MEIVIQYESRMIPIPQKDAPPILQEGAAFKVTFLRNRSEPPGEEDLCFTLTPNFIEFTKRMKRIGQLLDGDPGVKYTEIILPSKNGESKSGKIIISTKEEK